MKQENNAPNRLINEKSPYLLQHAYNPVDWYPWCAQAFQKAGEEGKPVFLSIGYSTCHWCHVMERESFEDAAVAAALNRDFVAVKVDREERPDIDAVYMAACQAMTGSGGWPLTILMTPDQKPFYAGTYLPKYRKYGAVGLMELLPEAARLWKTDRERLLQAGDEMAAHLRQRSEARPVPPERRLIDAGLEQFRRSFDGAEGGFGPAPKFPTPHNLLFLLGRYAGEGDRTALEMAERTLTQMYRGGLFDHVGGGFSRYSTDARWLVPHFEKMLYDNALLAYAYLEAYRLAGKPLYRVAAERTLDYVLRELRHENGAFLCGQDADSGGEEGKYYVFTPGEVETVLGKAEGSCFCERYGITESGNFEGKSIPNLLGAADYETLDSGLKEQFEKLREFRQKRAKLHRDDKVLTSWNALMIAALAKAYRVLGNAAYLEAAKKARDFLAENITDGERLLIRWREGEAAHAGHLDDYAFLAWALLELYQAGFDAADLREAARLSEKMLELFGDEAGGLYFYAADGEQLISRPKETYDGAIPSGNAAAALTFLRLEKLTGLQKWADRAQRQLSWLAGNIWEYPAGHSFALLAVAEALTPSRELVCALGGEMPEALEAVADTPVYMLVKTRENAGLLAETAPFTAAYPVPEEGAAYYLCRNGACAAPVFSLDELKNLLQGS